MVSHCGGGYSRFEELAVTRWRADATRDHTGQFCYVRDVTEGRTWSATYQPACAEPDRYRAFLATDRVTIHRVDGAIETRTEIAVVPADAAEVRRVTVTNTGHTVREIELTSYGEIVLAPPDATGPTRRSATCSFRRNTTTGAPPSPRPAARARERSARPGASTWWMTAGARRARHLRDRPSLLHRPRAHLPGSGRAGRGDSALRGRPAPSSIRSSRSARASVSSRASPRRWRSRRWWPRRASARSSWPTGTIIRGRRSGRSICLDLGAGRAARAERLAGGCRRVPGARRPSVLPNAALRRLGRSCAGTRARSPCSGPWASRVTGSFSSPRSIRRRDCRRSGSCSRPTTTGADVA